MQTIEKVSPFTAEWWDMFLDTTQNLSTTAVFKDCMPRNETHLLRAYVLQILQTLAKLRTNQYGYRVYVEGKQLTTHEMSLVYDNPPYDDEELEDWVARVFGDQKFGMILNLGEKFNAELSKNIALKTAPYLEKIGFPVEGINFSIFIGNYDKTPLGIHKDPPGQDVMHFHLGPGDKVMYTWGKAEYEELTKTIGKQDLDQLLPYAQEFSFGEGDMYFMPEGEYHIGKQDGLSVAVTFWRYNHTRYKLVSKLLNVIFSQFAKKGDALLPTDKHDLGDVSGLDESLSILEIPEDLAQMNLRELLSEAYSDLRHSIHSNAGYRTSPFVKKEEVIFTPSDLIQIAAPYKIRYKPSPNNEKLQVFVRGIKLEFTNFPCISHAIDKLNEGTPMQVEDFLNTLDQEWDAEIGHYILGLLYKNNGVVRLNN